VVRSCINLYGPSDLALLYRNGKSPEFGHSSMEAYIGGTPEEFPERYRALSPLFHVSPGSPPTITLLGASDRLIDAEQADLLNAALVKAGVRHEMVFLPANDHGFDFNWGGFATQVARAKIREFLAAHS
jgi:acetyl esterase/lipase